MTVGKDYCGVFGIVHPEASELAYLGIFSLQHRGQESAGIATCNGDHIKCHKAMGLVGQVFNEEIITKLHNPMAIGHVRYSTTGSSHIANAQPLVAEYSQGQIAIAHNGNLINAPLLRHTYEQKGHIFHTTSDTEVIVHLLAKPEHVELPDPLGHVLSHLQGSFSLVILVPGKVIAARDPFGIRPLSIGKLDGHYCVASETCAFDVIGAKYVRDVEPGEIVEIDQHGLKSRYFISPEQREAEGIKPAHCIFEHVYFADPASDVFGFNVHTTRFKLGQQLAREHPASADAVIAVPDSGRCAAMGYSNISGIRYCRGFVRSHYVGRTFIQPSQKLRDLSVKMKLNVIRQSVDGKRVVVVDDSIVRGTTTRGKMRALREKGAKEIHLRISSPPIRWPCYFGVDFPTAKELIAHERTVEDIRKFLEVDSVGYISVEGLLGCMELPPDHFCTACFTGQYPIPVDPQVGKFSLERKQLHMF
ncbi:MAG: amidophosphoribosyltransferase [Phycisphaerae bacterium]